MNHDPAPPDADRAQPCEVLVIGGGPAGATIASLLARQGRQVVLLEKEHHPRFHIGESLLPANKPLFERLGVLAEVERIGMPKWGVEFVSPQHGAPSYLEFGDAWDKSMPYAWQVRRSELDEILFRHAAASGATAIEGCRVRQVAFDDDGADVHATLDDGASRCWRAQFVVDASGRDTLLANQLGSKARNPLHNSAAVFGHFRGARRLQGRLEGNISIYWFQHGWFWFIPLADGVTSVGATCWPRYLKTRDKPLKDFFLDTIRMAPGLAERLEGAELVDDQVHATGNYSYTSRVCQGERWLMLGDAYAFIDPVFSSGVHLAMTSAFEGAELLRCYFQQPAQLPAARQRFEALMAKGPREFSWFIFRMTNPAMRDLFMRPHNPLGVKSAVLSLLAGDIYGKTPFWPALRAFKAIYYLASLSSLRGSWRAWRQRPQLVADVGPVPGETVMVERR
ncbi:MAG: NAD(P)/FAD-dependent oxidoreductase [Rubrivivax sp.]